MHAGADGQRFIREHIYTDSRRDLCAKNRHQFLHAVHHGHGVCARLFLDRQHDAACLAEPTRDFVVLHAVNDAPEFFETNGGAIAIGDDQFSETCCIRDLSRGLNGGGYAGAVQRAGRKIYICFRDRRDHFINSQMFAGQRARIELSAHSVFLWAENAHLRDARHRRDALCDERVGELIHFRELHRRRSHREVKDGGVRRIHFAKSWRARHFAR